jgi:hypothetical protein
MVPDWGVRPRADPRPPSSTDALLFVVLVTLAAAIRAWHLGGPSLWWDEIVHVHSAEGPGFADVWRTVRAGIPPGLGNAGAVPLDYLVLHAWTRVAGPPDPAHLELSYRLPSLIWSTAAVAAMFLWARRFLDSSIASLAALLLALSVPHSLYAVEVRSYSLFTLVTVLQLWAFSRLVLRVVRRERGGWAVFTCVGGVLFLTGMPGLFLLLAQYAILGVLALRELSRREGPLALRARPLIALVTSASSITLLVVLYYWDTVWWASYGRGRELAVRPLTEHALRTFAYRSPTLFWCFLAGAPLLLGYAWRRGEGRFAVALYVVGSFLAIPTLILLAQEKDYYFHFRHALFLLPHFVLVTAAGIVVALRALASPLARTPAYREAAVVLLGAAAIVVLQGPVAAAYLAHPEPFFAESKTVRDLRGFMLQLRARIAALGEGEKYLLIAERRRPGHLANPSLAEYLGWYGLAEHVVLRGTDRPEDTLRDLVQECADGCRGRELFSIPTKLGLPPPLGIRPEMKRLLGVSFVETASLDRLGGIGVIYWERLAVRPPDSFVGYDVTPRRGLTWYDLRVFPPRPP